MPSSVGGKVSLLRNYLHSQPIMFVLMQSSLELKLFLLAAAGLDDHVPVLLEDDIVAIVDVQHGDGGELSGRAAGLRKLWNK